FADITNFSESLLGSHPRERYHQALWNDGTTEGGSSGSPLMIEATQQVVGQLWGGLASCTATGSPDYYGRFDVSYPLMESWLAPLVVTPEADFSAASYSVPESTAATTLTVALSEAPGTGRSCSVDYATSDGTATAGSDYTAASGTLTFSNDETSKTIPISIAGDTTFEYDETIIVTLSDPSGCILAGTNDPATLTITNDDVDSDADSISDYDETNGVFGYVTNPNAHDTDGDGVSDIHEIMSSTDPTNPGDTPDLASFPVPFFEDR
ncbi:MAG: hypothetical protein GY851_11455, partial [bacterium]|nr:hypothetical protein [bacterium]